jgi:hypothetical protein
VFILLFPFTPDASAALLDGGVIKAAIEDSSSSGSTSMACWKQPFGIVCGRQARQPDEEV